MQWNPIILGIIENWYVLNMWMFFPLGIIGFLFCYFNYKTAWIVLPVVLVICIIFSINIFASQDSLYNSMLDTTINLKAILWMGFSLTMTFIGIFINWRKQKIVLE